MEYREFLQQKTVLQQNTGIIVQDSDIHPKLFPFQRDLVRFALRKGRAALFADTGLGKSFMQLEYARLTDAQTLILAPLSVARQTVREASKIDIYAKYVRSQDEVDCPISITNYEMLDHFDPSKFKTVILDESSLLKSLAGKTKQKLIDMFAETPNRLCCTATPSPNDIAEIANHAEFLGIMSRAEMLAMFFVHDDDGWRLKGHGEEPFYKWLASWGIAICKPSDLGYSDEGYELPELNIKPVFIESDYRPEDSLFFTGLKGITDRSKIRKATTKEKVEYVADMVKDDQQWIVWCGLNDESSLAHKLITDSINIAGSDPIESKINNLELFQDGDTRVLVTKAKIAGFGINLQNCHNMAFIGLNDSWESYYQCIRRSWRFGQKNPVNVTIVLSDIESGIWENIQRKDEEAQKLRDNLIKNVAEYEKAELGTIAHNWQYETNTVTDSYNYTLMLGDSAERLKELDADVVDLSCFSPPFMSLYTYSPTERDLGNCKNEQEFFSHFNFIIDELLRITKPGRNCAVHVAQVPAMICRDGYIGMKDFRGKTINAFEDRGWIYHGEVCIDKDPQAQSIRTRSKALAFQQLHKDSSWLRPALADYILVFRKPGDNKVPILPDITNDDWIEWARPIWYNIKETDTLNFTEAREEKDERHICPLQLGTIERCIRLWSNEGELVCDPFMGIGSTGYMALKLNRGFIGCELKGSYFETACKNLADAVATPEQQTLFEVA